MPHPPPLIGQVFTSTIAGGMYGRLDTREPVWETICQQLQRAAYLGTLLAAASLGKRQVALTLIGGGVFCNPVRLIWDAILWAVEHAAALLHQDLTVAVNGYNFGGQIAADELHSAARAHGGALIRFDKSGGTVRSE